MVIHSQGGSRSGSLLLRPSDSSGLLRPSPNGILNLLRNERPECTTQTLLLALGTSELWERNRIGARARRQSFS